MVEAKPKSHKNAPQLHWQVGLNCRASGTPKGGQASCSFAWSKAGTNGLGMRGVK